MRYLKIILIPVIFLCNQAAFGQEDKVENLRKYYHEPLHFGFTIGVNNTDFILRTVKITHFSDSLKVVDSKNQYGFNLGIIAEYRLHEYLTLRLLPDLSFASRTLNFHYAGVKDTFILAKDVESTFIEFPVDIKLRSKRLNNVAGYLVVGGKYIIDLASQKNAKNKSTNIADALIKLEKNDFAYQMGAGIDFFFPYFKFAIEGKLSVGTKNMLIKDGTELSNSIERLNSKMFLISFTFEGG